MYSAVIKGVLVNVLSKLLDMCLAKLGKGLNGPLTLAEASLRIQTQAVITRCKRETPDERTPMYVKFTFPKDISETTAVGLGEAAIKMIGDQVPASKFQHIHFGYERRGVIIKMKYKPRGCIWM